MRCWENKQKMSKDRTKHLLVEKNDMPAGSRVRQEIASAWDQETDEEDRYWCMTMQSTNVLVLTGNMTRDAELKTTLVGKSTDIP